LEEWERTYANLRDIYSGKDKKYDSLGKGREIEKLVNLIMTDIAKPLTQKLNLRLGKHEFDGEVVLGKGKTVLYEIYLGNLSGFRYDSILDLVRSTYFPRKKTYFLNIARSFSAEDEARIHKLVEKLVTKKVKLCFIDHNVLISLHQFSSKMEVDDAEKGLKIMKRLFLGALFESDSIIREDLFDSAFSFAKDRYFFEIQEPSVAFGAGLATPRRYEQRLQELESLLKDALNEIRELRRDINRMRRD